MNTYKKLSDGTWGIRVMARVSPNQSVIIHKKNGDTKTEIIDRILSTEGDISICTIKQTNKPRSQTKTCWECGCDFTYSDAKRNDGDWGDSYCGC